MPRRNVRLGALLTMAACLALAACAAGSPVPTPPAASSPAAGERAPSTGSGEQSAAASMLTDELGADPRFASVGVSGGGDGLVLYWHGEPPAGVLAAVANAHPDVPVEVKDVQMLPGDLRAAAQAILKRESAAGVGAVYVRPDGTGIVVLVHSDRVTESLDAMAARISSDVGVPVEIEEGAPVAASS